MAIITWLLSAPSWSEYAARCTEVALIIWIISALIYGIRKNLRNGRKPLA